VKKKLIILLTVITLLTAGSTLIYAQSLNPTPEDPITLRLGHENRGHWPDGEGEFPDAEHAFALVFKSILEADTNGAVKVEIFPNSTLGSAKEMTESVQIGTLDLAITTGAMGGFYPEFQVINIPYAFQSPEIAWWLFDNSEFWNDLMDDMAEETNIRALGMGQNGIRNFTNNERPIKEPADMEGLKFRVMESPIYVKTVEALGGNAVPIAWGELYTSLQTGVVDGQENPVSIIELGKLYEVQTYLTMDGHTWSESMMVINDDLYNDLPASIQQSIKKAAHHGTVTNRSIEEMKSWITSYEPVKENMEIYTPTPEQMKKFRETAQPEVLEWLRGQIGDEVVDDFLEAVEEAEEELGYQ